MYSQFRQRPRRFSRNNNQGAGNIKSFNPTLLINSFTTPYHQEEYLASHQIFDFSISEQLKKNILDKGYKTPTPIQDKAIEPILNGLDLVGVADTGTGKTAAFLIPLINKVVKDRNQKVLILTPTRELAVQIRDELTAFSKMLHIYSCLCIGGENIRKQIWELSRCPSFVIATPGRIKDLINMKAFRPIAFSSVVFDEADRNRYEAF
ncbi:MAG: DEAD/DEAH box helicase [Patescibacteria group bacterium]|nr:DEAD/DEAH box helicase [Patescibacteria group bacterium]